MPCVYVETAQFKDILEALPELPPHNWLITDLECYDDKGWDGCEKWGREIMFLTDEEFRRDVNLRNMQIIWGVFSAIPAQCTPEEIARYPLPSSLSTLYLSNHITPQHPLALVELFADDGWFTYVSSQDAALLQPLYGLPYKVRDEEASNKVTNAQLCRIQDVLRSEVPDVAPEVANSLQFKVWWAVFRNNPDPVDDARLRNAVMKEYQRQIHPRRRHRTIFWDPYSQK